MNKCVLSGRLVSDVELKTTKNGTSVSTNCLAVRRKQKNDEGGYISDFIDFTVWGNSAEYMCRYAKKGDMILISGAIEQQKYADKNGNNRVHYEIHGEDIELLKAKTNNNKEFYPDGDMVFD